MDQSPQVPAPRKGEPITAEWATKVADAANAVPNTPEAVGSFSSPFGSVSPAAPLPMLGTAPQVMPFDVRLVYDSANSAYDVYCAIFPGRSNVTTYGFETKQRTGGVGVGTNANPWVKIGSASGEAVLVLAFAPPTRTDGTRFWDVYEWDLFLYSGSFFDPINLPAWAWELSPIVPIAHIKRGSSGFDGGVLQMHRGAVVVGTPAVAPYSIPANLQLNGIGNDAGNAVVSWEDSSLATPKTHVHNLDLGAGTVYHGNGFKVVASTITDGNGVDHTVLEVVPV